MSNRPDLRLELSNTSYTNHGKAGVYNGTIVLDYGSSANNINQLIGSKTWTIKAYSGTANNYSSGQFMLVDNKNNIIKSSVIKKDFNAYTFSNTSNLSYGDVDYDGKISQSDAQMILKIALKSTTAASNLQIVLSDYDKNGKVELADAQAVLNKAMKIN